MHLFEKYFSISAIAWAVAKYHVRMSSRFGALRRSVDHVDVFSAGMRINHDFLVSILPPRSLRLRPPKQKRIRIGPIEARIRSIYDTIMMMHRKGRLPNYPWGIRFLDFVRYLHHQAYTGSWSPRGDLRLFPILKGTPSKEQTTRIICTFDSIQDRIFWHLFNRYLSDLLELVAHPANHSFRKNRSRHTAIKDILSFMVRQGGDLHVARADICSLYESISHADVLIAFDKLVDSLSESGVEVHSNTRLLIKECLGVYSYQQYLSLCKTLTTGGVSPPRRIRIATKHNSNAYGDSIGIDNPIGLPQGGPLSPVLASLVLHFVDLGVAAAGDHGLCYIRYCDDAIFLHKTEQGCMFAFSHFMNLVQECDLKIHQPQPSHPDGNLVASGKTIFPVEWRSQGAEWLPFLGYEIRFDGSLRIDSGLVQRVMDHLSARKESVIHRLASRPIDNETARKRWTRRFRRFNMSHWYDYYPWDTFEQASRLFEIRHAFVSYIYGRSEKSKPLAINSSGVLRYRKYFHFKPTPLSLAGSLCLLSDNPFVRMQLRQLDRHMEACIKHCLSMSVDTARYPCNHYRRRRDEYNKLCRIGNFFSSFCPQNAGEDSLRGNNLESLISEYGTEDNRIPNDDQDIMMGGNIILHTFLVDIVKWQGEWECFSNRCSRIAIVQKADRSFVEVVVRTDSWVIKTTGEAPRQVKARCMLKEDYSTVWTFSVPSPPFNNEADDFIGLTEYDESDTYLDMSYKIISNYI